MNINTEMALQGALIALREAEANNKAHLGRLGAPRDGDRVQKVIRDEGAVIAKLAQAVNRLIKTRGYSARKEAFSFEFKGEVRNL